MEYTSEEMQVLLRQESTTYATHDYLNSSACCPLMVDSHKFAQRPSSDDDSDSRNTRMKSESSYHRESKKRKLRQGYPQLTADMNSHHEDVRRRQLWREKVCEWVYQVVDHFGLSREIVTISMNTFDRHCAVLVQRTWPRKRTAVSPLDKEDYALTAITCLSITMKLYEYRRILVPGAQSTMETILKLCQSSFSMQQVEKKEFDVLNSVHWRVHPPTPQLFLHYMLIDSGFHESQESHELHDLALYIIEMSVLDYSFVTYKASEIALAALLNAMNTIMTSSTHSTDLSFLDNLLVYRTDRTRDCQKQLAAVYDDSTDAGADSSHYETTTRVQSPVSVTTDLQGSDRNNPKRGIQSPKGNISFDE